MTNTILIVILLLLLTMAVMRMKKHFKGGGCCGSGSTVVRTKKQLTAPKLGEKQLRIEGMHCENCQARVENAINRLEGAACTVNLKRKTATVSYSAEISDSQLKQIVEKLGYQVTEIR